MRYPGGKDRCYQHIASMMPPHRVYVETHLGGGAVLRHKRPAPLSIGIDRDPAVIALWEEDARANLELRCTDALEFLWTYRFRGDELVYCDSPYNRERRRRTRAMYRFEYATEDHVALISALTEVPCAVVVSGHRSAVYEGGLSNWTAVDFPGDSHIGPTVETVWRNFAEPRSLHDYAHIGAAYRERARIKRRRAGLAARIGSLSGVKWKALFAELAKTHLNEFRVASERGA